MDCLSGEGSRGGGTVAGGGLKRGKRREKCGARVGEMNSPDDPAC